MTPMRKEPTRFAILDTVFRLQTEGDGMAWADDVIWSNVSVSSLPEMIADSEAAEDKIDDLIASGYVAVVGWRNELTRYGHVFTQPQYVVTDLGIETWEKMKASGAN